MSHASGCRMISKCFVHACAFLLLLALTALAGANDYQDRQRELEALRAEMQTIERRLQERHGRADRISNELGAVEQAIGETVRRLQEVAEARAENQSRLADLDRERRAREVDVAEHRDYLRAAIREAYAQGNQPLLKVLLNQTDPAAVDRLMVYFDYLGRARQERIATALEQLRGLAEVEQALAEQRASLVALEREQRAQAETLGRQRDERAEVLASLQSTIAEDSRRLDVLAEDEAGLQALLDDLRSALADIPEQGLERPSFQARRGELPWPAEGRVLTRFGSREGRHDGEWRGVTIGAEAGTPIRAVSDGRVVFANWLRGFGLLLIIDHGDGYMTLYGHNDGLYADVGDWVDEGQLIAAAGNSGGRDRTGVYFEIRAAGQPQDPLPWLRQRS
jgi:murein hydrolase activator